MVSADGLQCHPLPAGVVNTNRVIEQGNCKFAGVRMPGKGSD